jgi:Raf kinase inhibitor-like YbhB/YbcL family protein
MLAMTSRSAVCVAGLVFLTPFLSHLAVSAQGNVAAIAVSSPTLTDGQAVPRQHTPDGRNDSPGLSWSGVPPSAKSLMVFCEDPDVGNPPPFVHWVVYNIPTSAKGLPEALPIDPAAPMPSDLSGAVQGTNGFRRAIYRGPAPPPGKPHSYHFVVYAVDTTVPAKPNTPPLTRAELLDLAKGHIVGRGELVATYERRGEANATEQDGRSAGGRGRRP